MPGICIEETLLEEEKYQISFPDTRSILTKTIISQSVFIYSDDSKIGFTNRKWKVYFAICFHYLVFVQNLFWKQKPRSGHHTMHIILLGKSRYMFQLFVMYFQIEVSCESKTIKIQFAVYCSKAFYIGVQRIRNLVQVVFLFIYFILVRIYGQVRKILRGC